METTVEAVSKLMAKLPASHADAGSVGYEYFLPTPLIVVQ